MGRILAYLLGFFDLLRRDQTGLYSKFETLRVTEFHQFLTTVHIEQTNDNRNTQTTAELFFR
jgi:hypothetical protein